MYQRRLFFVLLRPSLFSGIVTCFLGAVLFSVSGWAYVTHSPMFYDYFFGPTGVATTIDETSLQTQEAFSSLVSQSWVYNLVILVGAVLVGLAVYAFLQTIAKVMFTVSETIEEVQGGDSMTKHSVEKELAIRLAVRVVVAVIWIVHIYLTLTVALPFCVSLVKTGVSLFPSVEGVVYMTLAFAVFFAVMHLHVILLRLLLLRPRVFGGEYVIMGALEGY